MARRNHGCSYMASVYLVDTELITNEAAATKKLQITLQSFPIVISSYILGVV